MTLGRDQLRLLAERASHAARQAGELIASSRPQRIEHKTAGHSAASQVVTEIDRRAEDIILGILSPIAGQFDHGLLSEERADSGLRLEKEYFWCIDPLDGTLPFIEAEPGFAVSIALVSRTGDPVIGVVFDPVQGTLYRAVRDLGLHRNGERWTPERAPRRRHLSVFLDRSLHQSAAAAPIAEALQGIARDLSLDGVEIRAQAGAVMNACQVLERPPACYFKFPKSQEGGGSLWDFAASACLFREAGAVASDICGRPLDLNRPDSTFMNHRGALFATDEELAGRLRALYSP